MTTFLEVALRLGVFKHTDMIRYGRTETRKAALEKTQERVPWMQQFMTSAWIVAGPPGAASGLVTALVLRRVVGVPDSTWPSSSSAAALQFLALALVADFGLYWGHRLLHTVPFLWKLHQKHHKLATPSPGKGIAVLCVCAVGCSSLLHGVLTFGLGSWNSLHRSFGCWNTGHGTDCIERLRSSPTSLCLLLLHFLSSV